MESIQDTLEKRGKRYGEFKTHAKITQLLKGVVEQEPGYSRLNNSQRESIDMILHKLGRIINGDPNYPDSWVDIAGYAQLVVNELVEEKLFSQTGEIIPCTNPQGHPDNCEHTQMANTANKIAKSATVAGVDIYIDRTDCGRLKGSPYEGQD